jgi:hypothetical protein
MLITIYAKTSSRLGGPHPGRNFRKRRLNADANAPIRALRHRASRSKDPPERVPSSRERERERENTRHGRAARIKSDISRI